MKSVLMSIQPKWCGLIANGEKTIEVRKTQPRLNTPFKVYIYCTKNYSFGEFYTSQDLFATPVQGKVIGEFVCDKIQIDIPRTLYASHKLVFNSCVPIQELIDYVGEKNFLYFWHISNLVIYDKPRELSEFYVPIKDYWETYNPSNYINGCWQKPLKRPPQSWCYVWEKKYDKL